MPPAHSGIRVAIVLIRDREGRYFVHRRRDDKRIFPGLWGLGAGGRIEEGEAPADGAARELREETGLTTPIEPLEAFDYLSGEVLYTVHAYETRADRSIGNDDEEWQASGWRTRAEVEALLDADLLCPDTAEVWRRHRRTE